MTTTATIQDSRKRTRSLTITGMVKPSGIRCAKVTNEQGKRYFVQVRPDGSGTCQCQSVRPCYHMKAVLVADLPTFEELTAYTLAEAMADANAQMQASTREHHITVENGREASDEQYKRIVNAKPAKAERGTCYNPQPFSILR